MPVKKICFGPLEEALVLEILLSATSSSTPKNNKPSPPPSVFDI